jgi:TetR/AcrR family transcriptional regulator, cholesterol catabolism regulator
VSPQTDRSIDTRPDRPRRRDVDVLAAARKVFFERGYDSATVQDVADELGILKGSLYHYIRTKEDLLFRLFEHVHGDVDGILDEVAQVPDLEPLERLRLYVRRQVEYNLDNLAQITVYYHERGSLTGERAAHVTKLRDRHDRFVSTLIREAQRNGQADPRLDPRVVTPCVFAPIVWTYRWYRPNGRLARKDIAEMVAEFAISGAIGGHPAPSS